MWKSREWEGGSEQEERVTMKRRKDDRTTTSMGVVAHRLQLWVVSHVGRVS